MFLLLWFYDYSNSFYVKQAHGNQTSALHNLTLLQPIIKLLVLFYLICHSEENDTLFWHTISFLKIVILYLVSRMFIVSKTYYFSNTVHYYRSSMPRLSNASFSTKSFLPTSKVCSDWLTGTVHCDWPNTTSRVGNVTPLSIIEIFSFQNYSKDS